MADKLTDLIRDLFGGAPYVMLTYGQGEGSTMEERVHSLSTDTLVGVGLDLHGQIAAASGLYPMLIVQFDHRYPRDMQGDELLRYLQEELPGEEREFTYACSFGERMNADFLKQLLAHQADRKMTMFRAESPGNGLRMYVEVKRDEQYGLVFFATVPLPDRSVRA